MRALHWWERAWHWTRRRAVCATVGHQSYLEGHPDDYDVRCGRCGRLLSGSVSLT